MTLPGGSPPRRPAAGPPAPEPPPQQARYPAAAAHLLPEIVFAPAHPKIGDGQELVFEVRELPDGRRLLPVFSSQQRLVEAMGHAQPWAALPLHGLQEVIGRAGVPAIVVDPVVEQGAWRWQDSDLERLRRDLT